MKDYSVDDPFHLLIGRALTDPEFREAVLASRDGRYKALQDIGVAEPTDKQLEALEKAIGSLGELAAVFGMETRAA